VGVKRRLLQLLAAAGAFLFVGVALLLAASWAEWTPGDLPRHLIPVFLLVVPGVPAGFAVWVARLLRRRWAPLQQPSGATTRRIRQAVAAGYLLTAIFGVPAVLSQQHAWAVAEYKRLRASQAGATWDAHPYIQAYAALPVAPGVILSYHEYQLAGLYGLGGYELSVWYGAGARSLGVLPIWLS
jgi:hypothetical protein